MSIELILTILLIGEIAVLLEFNSKRQFNGLLTIIVILFVLSIVFRNISTVPDAIVYKNNYDYFKHLHNIALSIKGDVFLYAPLFSLVNQIPAYLGLDFKIISLIIAVINSLVVLKATSIICAVLDKESEFPIFYSIVYMLYIGYFGIFYNAIALRAGLSISFALLGYAYKLEQNRRAMIIFSLAAVGFHTSAIIFIIIIAFSNKKISIDKDYKYYFWWLGIVAIWLSRLSYYMVKLLASIMRFGIKLLPSMGRYYYYIDRYYNGFGVDIFASKKNILFLLYALLFIFARKYASTFVYDQLLNVYMIGLTITFLFNSINDIYRLADFFLIMSVPLLYNVLNNRRVFTPGSSLFVIELLVPIQYIISLRITGVVY